MTEQWTIEEFNQYSKGKLPSEAKKSDVHDPLLEHIATMVTEEKAIFIPVNVSSSKNSKQIFRKGNIPFITDSKLTKNYKTNTKQFYLDNANLFKTLTHNQSYPLYVGFYFLRKSRRSFDYINACQVVADSMRKIWIPDDDAKHFVPVFLGYVHDNVNPGVIITPMKDICELILNTI
jgi:hypothetical protein